MTGEMLQKLAADCRERALEPLARGCLRILLRLRGKTWVDRA